MSRLIRLGLAVMLLAGALSVGSIAVPGRAFACSCMPTGPEQIGTYAGEPGIVVFVGHVVAVSNIPDGSGHTRGQLAIERVYKGGIPSARMPVIGGGGGDCTMSLTVGQDMITAASFEAGVITPGLCMPYGDPDTPEGQALIVAATTAYGPGFVPPAAEGSPTAPPSGTPIDATDAMLPVAIGAALVVVVLLFALVALVTRRQGGRT